jgi:hypothetical protein
LDPDDQWQRTTGRWLNGKIEGDALTISAFGHVAPKRLIAYRIVFRGGENGTENKSENENRTGFKHDEH